MLSMSTTPQGSPSLPWAEGTGVRKSPWRSRSSPHPRHDDDTRRSTGSRPGSGLLLLAPRLLAAAAAISRHVQACAGW